jgi:hypothetical protein
MALYGGGKLDCAPHKSYIAANATPFGPDTAVAQQCS